MKCFEQSESGLKNEIMYLYLLAKNQNDFYENRSKKKIKPTAHERGNWLAHGEYMRRLEGVIERHGIKK